MRNEVLAIIPARYNSSRFPGKPLAKIGDITMIHRTYLQVKKSNVDQIVVATDDTRIMDEVMSFGGAVIRTSEDCKTGTDRVQEVVQKWDEAFKWDAIINIQGDEPFVDPEDINKIINLLQKHPNDIATLVGPFTTVGELKNRNVVKALVTNKEEGEGIIPIFTRSPIRFGYASFYRHLGVYGFSKIVFNSISNLEPTENEEAESLEQLRWFDNGYNFRSAHTENAPVGVDTHEDLEKVKDLI